MKLILKIFKSFIGNEFWLLAGNISFCALFAIIPMCFLLVFVAGHFLGSSNQAFQEIIALTSNVIPVGRAEFLANLQSVLDNKSSLGIFGVGLLFFTSIMLVSSIENAFDKIFKSEKCRNFFHSKALAIIVIASMTMLLFMPTMIELLETLFKRFGFNFPLSSMASTNFFFLIVSFIAFVLAVMIIPNMRIYFRYAAIGGVFFAFGLAVVKYFYNWYLAMTLTRYNLVYGSLTVIVLLLAWIFYLASLLLFSAEIVAAIQFARRGKVACCNPRP